MEAGRVVYGGVGEALLVEDITTLEELGHLLGREIVQLFEDALGGEKVGLQGGEILLPVEAEGIGAIATAPLEAHLV